MHKREEGVQAPGLFFLLSTSYKKRQLKLKATFIKLLLRIIYRDVDVPSISTITRKYKPIPMIAKT